MAQAQQRPTEDHTPRPFEVRTDGARHGSFRDLRDAIDAAKIVKRERPQSVVGVHDGTTGAFIAIDE